MTTMTATKARSNLYNLVNDSEDLASPIKITWKKSNAILVSESDWNTITETLYLLSIPNMRESISEGLKTSVDKCSDKLAW